MDALDDYRRIIEEVLTEYASVPYSHGEIEIQTIFDRNADHYLIMIAGWDRERRVHGALVHIDIVDGKIWIQRDGTEHGMANYMMEAGIPKDRIVLGFRAPEMRVDTGFAVA